MRKWWVVLWLALALQAGGETLWRIGQFDGSSGEFRQAAVGRDPVFVAGKNVDRDWYRFQPGPANGVMGGRPHPFTVLFHVEHPHGPYRLRVGMLYETPRLSYLRVMVNGHAAQMYFHPHLDFRAGDWEGTFVPQTSVDVRDLWLPATWVRPGWNRMVLTAEDDPAQAQVSNGAIAPGHSGIVYDALELREGKAAGFSARVIPTIFFPAAGEAVDVYATSGQYTTPPVLGLNGQTYRLPLRRGVEAGDQHWRVVVPEWHGAVQASVAMGRLRVVTTVRPARQWTVAIVPHEHLDVGFTDYAAKVAELHSQSIDGAMDLLDKTPEFRWTLDGSWVAQQYLAGRASSDRFFDHVRAGRLVIPPQQSNQHTGNASWEGLARSLYAEKQMEDAYRLPPAVAAHIVDVPSYTWAYASILHDAGMKYFLAASNSWRAPVMLLGRWAEKSPFYWEGPDGGRVLMWYSRAYLQMQSLFASPWRLEAIEDSLPVFLQAWTRPDYTAGTVIVFGTQLENTALDPAQAQVVSEFNRQYRWPHLEFATVAEALGQVEKEWHGPIPVYRGDFGPYWEDGYGSDARYTAVHRENQHRILTAEVLGAALSSVRPELRPDRTLLDDAWRNELLFDEHTWTLAGSTTQPQHEETEEQLRLKEGRVVRAQQDIDESIQRSWAQLEGLVPCRQSGVMVFNPLNWTRGGMVEADIPTGMRVMDGGQVVPTEVERVGQGVRLPGFGGGYQRVRFEARDVPPVGYKLYEVRPGEVAKTSGRGLENRFYRVTFDRAGVASVVDKGSRRNLVVPGGYRFGQYLYVTGGDNMPFDSLYRFGAGLRPPHLQVHAAVTTRVSIVGQTAVIESHAPNTPWIKTRISLVDHGVLVSCQLHKLRTLKREAAYIAFPFRGRQCGYGSQSAWVDPRRDELAGGSREWYVPTTWAAVHDGDATTAVVPLDAPLVCFGDIVRGLWPTRFLARSGTIFSWLMNNYWGTNFPTWQGGDFTFRYVVTSADRWDPAALTRFSVSQLTPLEHDAVVATEGSRAMPEKAGSLMNVDGTDVNLLTWKRAEDGQGTVLRLQECGGHEAQARISSGWFRVRQAWLDSVREENRQALAVTDGQVAVPLRPYQVVTVRLVTSP
ncbi:MAG TPA: glycosyl hydrolase-related protein [Candidatus Xenobia bacterium]|jgi:hypothetical protein